MKTSPGICKNAGRTGYGSRPARIVVLGALAIGFALELGAQVPLDPESRAALYQKPQDLIDGAAIDRLEQELQAGPAPDLGRIGAEARRELDRYYAQFIETKLTADERRDTSLSYGNLDTNALRRLILREDQQYARLKFQGESPYLFRLHRILGQVYESPDYERDARRALREYATALRYTGRELPELATAGPVGTPVLPASDPLDGDPAGGAAASGVDAEIQVRRERVYMAMLHSFADPDRIAQEQDPALAAAARDVRDLVAEYKQLQPELAEARRGIAVAEAAQARGTGGVPTAASARATLQQVQARFDGLSQSLEAIRTGAYRTYVRREGQREGALVYRMALLSRELDLANKNRQRTENRSSYERGIGDQAGVDRTPHRDFAGYRMLLQLAHRLDPENLTYLDLLTEDFRTSRKLREAIAFQERYLELAAVQAPPPDDLHRHYLRLGGLYSDQRNYIQAARAYQEYLERAPDRGSEEFLQISLGLADMHFEHTGRLAQAAELYQTYLNQRAAMPADPASYEERALWRAGAFRIQTRLAAIWRRSYRADRERAALEAARAGFGELEDEYEAAVAAEQAVLSIILETKRELLQREDAELQRRYYRLQRIDLPAARARAGYLRTRVRALNQTGVLERLAFFAYRDRRFPEALELYREIIQRGDGAGITRARANIERINLTLGDGRLRPPLIDPTFER